MIKYALAKGCVGWSSAGLHFAQMQNSFPSSVFIFLKIPQVFNSLVTLAIINQSIWNNKFILREGDSIFYPSLHGKGLLFIRDLLDETGSFLNWSLVKEKFSLRNEDYMNWMSVIQSIPTAWRKEMKTSIAVISSYMNPPNYSLSHVSARSMYTKLIQPMFKPPTSHETIEKLFNNYEVNWKQSYLIPQKVTIDTSLRIFQYKILNNILYLNEGLSRIDLTAHYAPFVKKGRRM